MHACTTLSESTSTHPTTTSHFNVLKSSLTSRTSLGWIVHSQCNKKQFLDFEMLLTSTVTSIYRHYTMRDVRVRACTCFREWYRWVWVSARACGCGCACGCACECGWPFVWTLNMSYNIDNVTNGNCHMGSTNSRDVLRYWLTYSSCEPPFLYVVISAC